MNNHADRAKQFLAFAALSGFERLLAEQEKAAEKEEKPVSGKNFSEFTEFIQKKPADSC